MKNFENMNVLNDIEMAKVAGGDGLPTIFNPGPDVTMGLEKDIVPSLENKNHQLNNAESG